MTALVCDKITFVEGKPICRVSWKACYNNGEKDCNDMNLVEVDDIRGYYDPLKKIGFDIEFTVKNSKREFEKVARILISNAIPDYQIKQMLEDLWYAVSDEYGC